MTADADVEAPQRAISCRPWLAWRELIACLALLRKGPEGPLCTATETSYLIGMPTELAQNSHNLLWHFDSISYQSTVLHIRVEIQNLGFDLVEIFLEALKVLVEV